MIDHHHQQQRRRPARRAPTRATLKQSEDGERDKTIDEVTSSMFVLDIQELLDNIGCSPQCIEDRDIYGPIDAAHDIITAGPCFDRQCDGSHFETGETATPSKIEVMLEGSSDTIIGSTSVPPEESMSSGDYESFGGSKQTKCGSLVECLNQNEKM